jgi:hypothetical protein
MPLDTAPAPRSKDCQRRGALLSMGAMSTRRAWSALGLSATLTLGCASQTPDPAAQTAPPPPAPPAYDQLARAAFNLRAAQTFTPLFWREDADKDGFVDPDEIAVLTYTTTATPGPRRGDFVDEGRFTLRFDDAYRGLVASSSASDDARRAALRRELAGGRPTLVASDFRDLTEGERRFVAHVLRAAALTEALHMKQKGTYGLDAAISADDRLSRAVFHRNQGPACEGPTTADDAACTAIAPKPEKRVGVYPAAIQRNDPQFCESLSKALGAEFQDHFSVVVEKAGGGFAIAPYHQHYAAEMGEIAAELDAARAAMTREEEGALRTYLEAAAKAFRDGSWTAADEAWAAMSVKNSRWYLRIAPDEVYWDPCAQRAGFAVSFAQINKGSLVWQEKLEPQRDEMEKAIAKLAGPPYAARKVGFKLPDFLDMILNAGDARSPVGATIGQSLPNWGPVADKGGRTMVMVNLYTDADSIATLREQAESLLCASAMEQFTNDPSAATLGTVLHEAAHNLGPAHDYKVQGKTDDEAFGGPLASTLEELKAQSAALYFTEWLAPKKLIGADEASKAHVRNLVWAFGHISRGMYTATKEPKPYSQLAMIQLGFLMKEKAVSWDPKATAANGKDVGCFGVDLTRWPDATQKLMATVASIKGRGDKVRANKLKGEFVDAKGELETLRATISERMLRSPKASFVYAIDL